MKESLYKSYCKKWDKWKKDEAEYYDLKHKLIKSNASNLEFKELDKKYGHDGFNAIQFGPFVIINDVEDLLDMNFILPGLNICFLDLNSTDLKIPSYFGKKLISKDFNVSGIVVSYGYDATDDYIGIKTENGLQWISVNSHYHIEENGKLGN